MLSRPIQASAGGSTPTPPFIPAAVDEIPADEESAATLRSWRRATDSRVRRAAAGHAQRRTSCHWRGASATKSFGGSWSGRISIATSADGRTATPHRARRHCRPATARGGGTGRPATVQAAARACRTSGAGSIAQAAHPGTAPRRQIAVGPSCLNVAVKTRSQGRRCRGAGARSRVEQAGELRETLDLVAARAKNKSVSRGRGQ